MKRIAALILIIVFLAGCGTQPAESDDASAQQQFCLPEDMSAPYLNPLEQSVLNDAEEIFDNMRVRINLPTDAQNATYSLITTRRGEQAAQVRFWHENRLYYYRIAYSAEQSNIADDELSYTEITEQEYNGQKYIFCTSPTAGRAQWYEEMTGTSRSLFTPSDLDAQALQTVLQLIIAEQ